MSKPQGNTQFTRDFDLKFPCTYKALNKFICIIFSQYPFFFKRSSLLRHVLLDKEDCYSRMWFEALLLLILLSEVFHEIHKCLDVIKFHGIVHRHPYSSNWPENERCSAVSVRGRNAILTKNSWSHWWLAADLEKFFNQILFSKGAHPFILGPTLHGCDNVIVVNYLRHLL